MARIVFDLDGTLIDSAPDLCGIANRLLEAEGLAPITLAQARNFIGKGVAVFISQLREAYGIADHEQARLVEAFYAQYDDAVGLTEIYPFVIEALDALKAQGHLLGICTNKPIKPTMAVLNHLDLTKYFDTFWGGDSLAVHKPDPAPLIAAYEALGAGERLYVGDSEVDAATAEAAHVPFFLFTEGYRKSPIDALPHQRAFSSFSEFPALVEAFLS